MERVFVKKYAEFLTAYSDGKTIQCAIGDTGDWYDIKIEQIFDYVYPQLRIKPETKRVALNQQDLIDRELSGKVISVIYNKMVSHILRYSESKIYFSDIEIRDYEYLMDFTFLDGTPCYKEVESE